MTDNLPEPKFKIGEMVRFAVAFGFVSTIPEPIIAIKRCDDGLIQYTMDSFGAKRTLYEEFLIAADSKQ